MISPPRTLEEAKKYRYGSWPVYLPVEYMEDRCAWEVVRVRIRWDRGHQCLRLPGDGPCALYCVQHARIIAKREART